MARYDVHSESSNPTPAATPAAAAAPAVPSLVQPREVAALAAAGVPGVGRRAPSGRIAARQAGTGGALAVRVAETAPSQVLLPLAPLHPMGGLGDKPTTPSRVPRRSAGIRVLVYADDIMVLGSDYG